MSMLYFQLVLVPPSAGVGFFVTVLNSRIYCDLYITFGGAVEIELMWLCTSARKPSYKLSIEPQNSIA